MEIALLRVSNFFCILSKQLLIYILWEAIGIYSLGIGRESEGLNSARQSPDLRDLAVNFAAFQPESLIDSG